MLCFVLINRVILNLLCVWILITSLFLLLAVALGYVGLGDRDVNISTSLISLMVSVDVKFTY